jgi:hypothetical protein
MKVNHGVSDTVSTGMGRQCDIFEHEKKWTEVVRSEDVMVAEG